MSVVDPSRSEELRARLVVVRDRIVAAARSAGRDPAELTLLAVSKTWPFEDVVALCSLGVRHFAENREQEAAPKAAAVRAALARSEAPPPGAVVLPDRLLPGHAVSTSGLLPEPGAGRSPAAVASSGDGASWAGMPPPGESIHRPGPVGDMPGAWSPSRADGLAALGSATQTNVPVWHYVGQLQRNKARAVSDWAHCVQSVDRVRLVDTLSRVVAESGSSIAVCIQIDLDLEVGSGPASGRVAWKSSATRENVAVPVAVPGLRGGARPADALALAELVKRSEGLVLAGVMAVAPRGVPARPAFARLREVSERLRSEFPAATMVSAGMSGDLEDAIAEGATHLRIGTALFGERHGVP